MKLVTGSQMKALDREAIEGLGMPSLVLMENAGRAVAAVLRRQEPQGPVVVVCGKGNNGGDGMVAARALREAGLPIEVFLLGEPERCSEATQVQWQLLGASGVPAMALADEAALERLEPALARAAWIVDALLGIGVRGAVRGFYAEAIRRLNAAPVPKLALDVPSGVDADRGRVEGEAVRARLTVTLGLPKTGLLLYPGRHHVGRLEVVPIGYPPALVERFPSGLSWVERAEVAGKLPSRPADGHKGTFGRALIVAGSQGLSGAALLAGAAALRSGVGLVHLAYPASLDGVVSAALWEAVKHPLPETQGAVAEEAWEAVEALLPAMQAVALGPGLSRRPTAQALVHRLIPRVPVPLVLDADGLNALVDRLALLRRRPAPTVLTPHPGEFARLSGLSPQAIADERAEVARRFAREHGVVLVLKGAPTVTASPEGEVFFNGTGNAGLAKGGSGDVLTGLIVSLLAQGLSAVDAAVCGVWLHGRAADLGRAARGERALAPRDLLERFADAFCELESPEG